MAATSTTPQTTKRFTRTTGDARDAVQRRRREVALTARWLRELGGTATLAGARAADRTGGR